MAIVRKSTVGTRGKYAEGKVKAELEKLALKQNFAYYRPPDARAGSKKEAPADFITVEKDEVTDGATWLTLLEVKEVSHDFRLPKKNFPQEQRARMRMWDMAGAQSWLVVLHTNTNQWRLLPLSYFDGDFDDKGSWDFSALPTYKLPDLIRTAI